MSSPAASASPAWANRIASHGEDAPDQLLAHPFNWRVHGKAQRAALRDVLATVGYVAQVIVNQRTGHLVDGHLRVEEALSHGQPSIPVLYVDLSEDEERLVLAGLDPLAAMGTTDEAKLRGLLAEVSAEYASEYAHGRIDGAAWPEYPEWWPEFAQAPSVAHDPASPARFEASDAPGAAGSAGVVSRPTATTAVA